MFVTFKLDGYTIRYVIYHTKHRILVPLKWMSITFYLSNGWLYTRRRNLFSLQNSSNTIYIPSTLISWWDFPIYIITILFNQWV